MALVSVRADLHGRLVHRATDMADLSLGWHVPKWVVVDFLDEKGVYPGMRVRAEIVGARDRPRAIVASVEVTGAPAVTTAQVQELAKLMPDLAGLVLWHAVVVDVVVVPPSPEDVVRVLRAAARQPEMTQVEREDEVLDRWEREFQPQGMTQKQAAEEMGLAHSSFRSYLTHARARAAVRRGD